MSRFAEILSAGYIFLYGGLKLYHYQTKKFGLLILPIQVWKTTFRIRFKRENTTSSCEQGSNKNHLQRYFNKSLLLAKSLSNKTPLSSLDIMLNNALSLISWILWPKHKFVVWGYEKIEHVTYLIFQ